VLDHEKGRFVLNTAPKSAGFTLIEVMVVVAVIAIVTMLGLPSYRAWIQNSQIYNSAESVQNGLQRAKAEAVARNVNVAFSLLGTNPNWVSSWTITDVSTGATIESRIGGEGSKNVTAIGYATDGTSAKTITFTNLGGVAVNAPASSTLARVDFDSVNSAQFPNLRKLRVTIGLGGNVRMCDRNLGASSTDPRKC
jgi:type IV fimbrial biogenesis protein FimT